MQLSIHARKAMAAGLAASTLLWAAVGVVPQIASADVHSEGCLVLSGGIVWMITGGTRRGYTSAEVFQSWGYNFSQVVTATAEDVALPVGPIMVYADGTLVKGPSDPLVYLVTNGQKRPFTSGSVFLGLGFSFANIQSAPFNTFADLPTGSNLDSTTIAHPAGVQVLSNGAVWWMDNNGRRGFSSGAQFNSYGYMFSHVVQANSYDLALPNIGDVPNRAACSGGGGSTPPPGPTPPPVSGPVSVSLASDNPASGTLVAGSSSAELAKFMFSGSGTVVGVTLKRLGVSSDITLPRVYLYNGATRLTDAATVSSDGTVQFSGLNFAVNGSTTVSARADVASGTSGQTVGIQLIGVTLSGGASAGGLPVSGNIHNIATVTDLATVTMTAPTGSGDTSAANDVTIYQTTFNVGNRTVNFTRLALREIGSINLADIRNFRLLADGETLSTVANLDTNGYVTFSMNKALTTGNHTIRVIADIIGGSSRTFSFSLRNAADVGLIDPQYNAGITVTGTTIPATTASATVAAGSMTIEKATNSVSGNVTTEANNVSLGTFKLVARGESVKIEDLLVDFAYASVFTATATLSGTASGTAGLTINGTAVSTPFATDFTTTAANLAAVVNANGTISPLVGATSSGAVITLMGKNTTTFTATNVGTATMTNTVSAVTAANAAATLRNGRVYVNGSQVGSTTTLSPLATGGLGTSFTTNFTVVPGTDTMVEVRADLFDNDGLGVLNSGDTIKVSLDNTTAQGLNSLNSIVVAGPIDANLVSIASGTLTVTSTSTVGNATVVPPASNKLLASFDISGNSTEDVNVDTVTVTFTGTHDVGDVNNVYLKVGGLTSSVKATVTKTTGNVYSMTFTVPKNGVQTLEVYGDVSTALTSTQTIITAATVAGRTASSNAAVTSTATGRTLTFGAGTISALYAGAPSASLLADAQTGVVVSTYNVSTLNEAQTIQDITVSLADPDMVSAVKILADGTLVATKAAATSVVFNDLGIPVNGTKVISVALDFATIDNTKGLNDVTASITAMTAAPNSTGVEAAVSPTGLGEKMYVLGSYPTLTSLALPNTVLSDGIRTLAKFSVTPNGGTLSWKEVTFGWTKSIAGISITGINLYDADSGALIAKVAGSAPDISAGTSGVSYLKTSVEQTVSGTRNYEIRGTVGGSLTTNSVTFTLANSSLTAQVSAAYATVDADETTASSTFIWSDMVGDGTTSHSVTSTDWHNDFLVRVLPLSWSQTKP